MKEKIFVFGAGGHAKVVIDAIMQQKVHQIAFVVDDAPSLKGENLYGYPVLGGKKDLLLQREEISSGIVAIGCNRTRTAVASWLVENGFKLVTAVHPFTQLAGGVTIGAGTVVMAGVVINSDSHIGTNAIINTRASIDHDCMIGDGAHIAPGSTLCGTVRIGDETLVGAGATVIPNIVVGRNAMVGAGSTVVRDVPDGMTVVGNPARSIASLQRPSAGSLPPFKNAVLSD